MCMENNKYKNQIIISGPCSIESKEQFFNTCDELLEIGINFIRGGVWKPRTKPGSFEGLGEIALIWMKEYKTLHPEVKMCCEVANKEHTKLALDYGIDVLWVGARTTSDPFAVQDICDTIVEAAAFSGVPADRISSCLRGIKSQRKDYQFVRVNELHDYRNMKG